MTGLQGTGKSTMADVAAAGLGAAVLGHDWAMSGLRPFPELQAALDAMGRRGHRGAGWSILWALAAGGAAPGPARGARRGGPRARGGGDPGARWEEGVPSLVVLTECSVAEIQRDRIEGRERGIPGWYELEWDHVARARSEWAPLDDVDVTLDAVAPLGDNVVALRDFLGRWCQTGT